MRQIQSAIACLAILMIIQSCRPKNKDHALQNLLGKDSVRNEIKGEKKELSARELIVQKWRVTGTEPALENEEERQQMLSTLIEFTRDGRVMVTDKGETKQEATYTLSMDDRYMLSAEDGKDKIDTLFIAEINPTRLVLIGEKDRRKLILQPQR